MPKAFHERTVGGIDEKEQAMPSPAVRANHVGDPLVPAKKVKVAHVMRSSLVGCRPETPVREVAELMIGCRVYAVIVDGIRTETAAGPRLVTGIVSDLDLARAVDQDPERLTAGQIATTETVTVEPGRSLREAARLMSTRRVRHLLVISEHSGLAVGVLSALDVAGALAAGECT
jgi:CBS domain-containing protein